MSHYTQLPLDDVGINANMDGERENHTRKRMLIAFLICGALVTAAVSYAIVIVVMKETIINSSGVINPGTYRFQATGFQTDDFMDDYSGVFVLHENVRLSSELLEFSTSLTNGNQTQRMTLHDDRLYYEVYGNEALLHAGCMPQEELPPYMLLPVSFQAGIDIPDNASGTSDGCEGYMKSFVFEGTDYVLCFGGEAGYPTMLLGERFEATIQLVDPDTVAASEIQPPTLDAAGHALICPQLNPAASHEPLSMKKSHQKDEEREERDKEIETDWIWPRDKSVDTQYRRGGKRCVFFHGTGATEDLPATTTYTEYWGNLHKETPQCGSRSFAHFDTSNREWNDATLMSMYCDLLQPNENGYVEDTIIFSHSMGNLILGAALGYDICRLADSSSWYESQGPMAGTVGADIADHACLNWWDWVAFLAESMGFCKTYDTGHRTTTIAYTSMVTTNDFTVAQQGMRDNADGAMCGISSWGLNSLNSPQFAAVSAFVGFGEDNDGVVPWSSCNNMMGYANGGSWGTSYKDAWYKAAINHADGTCDVGDGWWGSDRKPCSWFANRS